MKRLFIIIFSLCLFFSVKAQNPASKLVGTWEIKKLIYSNNPNNNEQHTRFKKYKSFTPTHFTVTEVDANSNITTTSIFGTYSIKDGIYNEKILNVNRESAGMIGKRFSFTITFEGNDKMIQTGSFNGMKTSEQWERIKAADQTDQLLQGVGTSVHEITTKEVKSPLYVINTPQSKIQLKAGKDNSSPLQDIPQNQISAIEVVKGEEALGLFNGNGKNGIVYITIKERNLEEVLRTLKDLGYID